MGGLRLVGLAALVWAALLAGCGGGDDGGGGVITPQPVDPSGQWSVTWRETSSTCGPVAPVDTHDVLLTLTGNGTQLAWQDEGEQCNPTPDFAYSNNAISDSSSDQFQGSDGCEYQEVITGSTQFTQNNFSGSFTTRYTRLSGTNCSDYATSPCEIRTSITGTRCQGCYGGCL